MQEILGTLRVVRKAPGTVLKSKTASGTLDTGTVAEGAVIPYSQFTVTEKEYGTIKISKHAKAVTLEAIEAYGYEIGRASCRERV